MYVDEFEIVSRVAIVDGCDAEGVLSKEQVFVRQEFDRRHVPRSDDKTMIEQFVGVSKGLTIDGRVGDAAPTQQKLANIMPQTAWILCQKKVCKQWMQQLMGRWNHMLEVNRSIASNCDHIYYAIDHAQSCVQIDARIRTELCKLLMLLPLMRVNMRRRIYPWIFAVDASNTGAGVVIGDRLSPAGRREASHLQNLPHLNNPPGFILIESFAGLGGARLACDLLGVTVLLHIAIENDRDVLKLVVQAHPGVVVKYDIAEVNYEMLCSFRKMAPGACAVINVGGSPCQDLSSLNVGAQGLEGDKSSLFFVYLKVLQDMEIAFQDLIYLDVLENVASMDKYWVGVMSRALNRFPLRIGSESLSRVRRSRLFWLNFDIVSILKEYGWVNFEFFEQWIDVKFDTVAVDFEWALPCGWSFPGFPGSLKTVLPTCTRAIPRRRPPVAPAGIHRLDAAGRDRYYQDWHRFPPYTYASEVCFKNEHDQLVVANSDLREFLHWLPPGHTKLADNKIAKRAASEWDLENFRCSAVGNGFHVGVVAFIIGNGLYAKGLLDHPISPGMLAVKFLEKDKADFLDVFKEKSLYYQSCPDVDNILGALQGQPFKGKVIATVNATQVGTSTVVKRDEMETVDATTSETDEFAASSLALSLMTRASVRGTDIRLDTGTPFVARGYPRVSVNLKRWHFRVLLSYKWLHKQHINALEVSSVRSLLEWCLRTTSFCDTKFLVASDSQVAISILSKCRTSSLRIKSLCRRICSLCLVGGLAPVYIWVQSKHNPADRPSRMVIRTAAKWAKRRGDRRR